MSGFLGSWSVRTHFRYMPDCFEVLVTAWQCMSRGVVVVYYSTWLRVSVQQMIYRAVSRIVGLISPTQELTRATRWLESLRGSFYFLFFFQVWHVCLSFPSRLSATRWWLSTILGTCTCSFCFSANRHATSTAVAQQGVILPLYMYQTFLFFS